MASENGDIAERYVSLGIVKELTLTERMSVPGPTQVSNRTIYDRCLAWGCKKTRTNGTWVWMQAPFGSRFKIRAPQQHEANGKPIIEAMLSSLYLPWPYFIAAEIGDLELLKSKSLDFVQRMGSEIDLPSDEMGPCSICNESVYRDVMVKSGKKIAHKYCVEQPPAEIAPTPTPEETEPVPLLDTTDTQTVTIDEEPEDPEMRALQPRGRYINKVFDLLVERGDPMSNRVVAETLNITSTQAGQAMAGLVNLGVAVRVKAGVYQAKPGLTRKDGTVGLVVSGGIVEHSTPFISYGPSVTDDKPQPIVRTVTAADDEAAADEDETLNELLDLICPGGFKARHLPIIDQFKRCALALMREVNQ